MPMTGKEILKLYLKNGWALDHVTGSHHIVIKGLSSVSIPVHNKELKKGNGTKVVEVRRL
jgi:predicted RNA binding protein YcfA (HicA-like mRNA interferase family)